MILEGVCKRHSLGSLLFAWWVLLRGTKLLLRGHLVWVIFIASVPIVGVHLNDLLEALEEATHADVLIELRCRGEVQAGIRVQLRSVAVADRALVLGGVRVAPARVSAGSLWS